MEALVYEAPRVMTMRDLDRPKPGPGDVLIRVAYSGICGSELSGFLGTNSLRRPPLVFGHEVSGWVEELGSELAPADRGLAEGMRVTANPLASCGRCLDCLGGEQQRCASRSLLGAHVPGSNAQYVVVPARSVLPLPESMELTDAAMIEPAACAVRAVRISGAGPTSRALVVGAGPIGLFLLQVLEQAGVEERYVVDLNEDRLAMAVSGGALGLSEADVAAAGSVAEAVRGLTGGRGVDLAFDAVGSAATRQTCLAAAAVGGQVVLVGLHSDETSLPLNTVVRSETRLTGVFAYNELDFRTALAWFEQGRLGLVEGLVVAPLSAGAEWFARLVAGDPAAKVLLEPTQVR